MNGKDKLKNKINAVDFAIHELVLFLDTHPTNQKAMALLKEYRLKKEELIKEYESKFGTYIVTTCDVPASECWQWLDGKWPWEYKEV
jgi:spore coat protein JB